MRTARGLGEEVPRLLPANSSSTDDASLKTEVVSPNGSPLSLTLSESPSTKRAGQCLSEDERPSKERRRVCHRPVANACTTCRKAKVKCSGKHPTCIRCLERGLACEYDVAQEGISKVKDLRQKLDVRTGELSSATKLLNVLRTSSDEVAAEVLARLRLGQSNEQIQERLRDIQSTTPSQSGSPSSPHPSIRDSTDAITAPLEHQDRNALPQSTVEPLGRRHTHEAQFASLASLYYHNMAMATAEASGTRMHGVEMGSLIDPAVLTDGSTGLEPNARGT